MTGAPAVDAWAWGAAQAATWSATLDPVGIGARLRAQRLAAVIETARRRSPLYRPRLARASALADLEPVTRDELMRRFDDWATDRAVTWSAVQDFLHRAPRGDAPWLGGHVVWTSSGTRGEPGIFVQDAASLAAYDAIDNWRLRADAAAPSLPLAGWTAGRRIAYVGAIDGPYAGRVALARVQALAPWPWRPRLQWVSVLEPLDAIAEHLQQGRPQVLVTYPSCAAALAGLQAAGELALALDEVWVGGEQLSPAQRDAITSAFGARVRNSYGASEFFSIACACSHGALHLNDDWVLLEPADASMRPVEAGRWGDCALLTHLANHVQPLLRYRLDDRVRLRTDRCACGSRRPVVEVQGRSDDTLRLPGIRGRAVDVLPLALETAIEEATGVARFQVLQTHRTRLELRLESGVAQASDARARCRAALQAFLRDQGVRGVVLRASPEAPLRQAGSGKLMRVLRRTA